MKRSPFALIVLIIIGVLIAVQAVLGNIVAEQLKGWLGPWAVYVLPIFLLITAGLIGYSVRDQLPGARERQDGLRDHRQAAQNRRAMLGKVRTIWIDGLLTHSLYRETLIALGLHERPDAVVRPLDVLVRLPQQASKPLPPDKRISVVFDECDGALLILGAPGAGKTTLLLELARDLLDRAERDANHPIPVVFPLSSWAERRLPLVDWLVDELNKRYDVPRKLAQAWVATDTILPLLDGLDEVRVDVRRACADAINTYRQEHGLHLLAVSSRSDEYDALTVKLRLHGAVVVQPLSRDQVKAYLRQIGVPISPSTTSPLWELLDTPLMLYIATLTYAGQGAQDIPTAGTTQEQRTRLFTAYVACMFERRPASQHFPQDRTLTWLAWLAWQMQQHNQTVFYLEHLQPEWLPTRSARWQYTLVDRVGWGLVFGLVFGLAETRSFGLSNGLIVGMLTALLAALFGEVNLQPTTSNMGVVQRLRNALLGGLVVVLVVGLVVMPVVMLLNVLLYGLVVVPVVVLLNGLVFGMLKGLIGAFAGALIGGPHILPRRITAVEALHWSWRQAGRSLLTGLVVGLVVGLLDVLLSGLYFGLAGGLVGALVHALSSGLFFGLSFGLSFGLVGGVMSSVVEQKVRPNQGIRRSGRNALVVGLGTVLVFALVNALVDALLNGIFFGLNFELVSGPVSGLVVGFAMGGYAYLSHIALRLVLWHRGAMPLAYVRFLDFAAERILLRKVGGGYIFIHRMLLDYFAKQYTGPETTEQEVVG